MPTVWPARHGDLTLRDATPADIEQVLTFRNDPGVNRFMIRTHVDPDEFRREWQTAPNSPLNHSCVAILNGRAVAMGFLEIAEDAFHPQTPRHTDAIIGYIVDPDCAGRGIATTLTQALLEAAFERLGLRRVRAYCNRDNHASVRVLEKTGLRREQHGVRDTWHSELGWVDGYGYAMLADEWRGALHDLPEIRDASAAVARQRPLPRAVTGQGWPRSSDRLTLDRATPDDIDQILTFRNLPAVGRWMLQPVMDASRLGSVWLEPSPTNHSFVARVDGRTVGMCSIFLRDATGQPGGPTERCEASIGYSLDPAFQGRGLAREMVAAALDVCFRDLGLHRVTAGLYVGNVPSARLLESLGLRREQHGVRDSWHHDLGWVDGAAYAILADEWRPDERPGQSA